jgi:hypothetical protein
MKSKAIPIVLVALAGLYIATYAILSMMGGYRFDQSGLVRYGGALSASDLEMWHPWGAWFQADFVDVEGKTTSRGNAVGYLFSPLIRVDRALIHKTKVIEEVRQAAEKTR